MHEPTKVRAIDNVSKNEREGDGRDDERVDEKVLTQSQSLDLQDEHEEENAEEEAHDDAGRGHHRLQSRTSPPSAAGRRSKDPTPDLRRGGWRTHARAILRAPSISPHPDAPTPHHDSRPTHPATAEHRSLAPTERTHAPRTTDRLRSPPPDASDASDSPRAPPDRSRDAPTPYTPHAEQRHHHGTAPARAGSSE